MRKLISKVRFEGVLFLGVVLVGGLQARSSVDRALDTCSGDNTCMSKVLAELIEKTADSNGNNNNNGDVEYVEFYHDDGKCEPAKLLIKVKVGTSEQRCGILASTVSDRVWGIKIEGRCADISDLDFLPACTQYASIKSLNRRSVSQK